MSNTVLSLRGVSGSYEPGKQILADVSFDIEKGEIVAVLGASGSGKSTLLLLIGGFLSATSGAMFYRGQAITQPSSDRILLTQFDSTWPWKRALENVAYPLRCQGQSRLAAKATASRWLGAVGLGDYQNYFPGKLSGGMRQRVGLAKVFALGPELLLLDEPMVALDEITRHTVNNVFLRLWRQTHMTVLWVTHSINEALYVADRLVILGETPARVLGSFKVPCPRPPSIENTFSAEADVLRVKVLRLLTESGGLIDKNLPHELRKVGG